MSSRNFLRRPAQLLLLLIAFFSIQAVCAYAQSNVNDLHRVKSIYIETHANVSEEIKIDPFLKAELEKRGFEIVNDVSKADAVLSGEMQAEIVLHGDGSIPDKSIYSYQLTLPSKQVVWKAKIKFVSKASLTEDNKYAAAKIAEKIAKKIGAK